MDEQLPFAKPGERLEGDREVALGHLPAARKLLFHVRRVVANSLVPIFAATRKLPDGSTIHASMIDGVGRVRVHGVAAPVSAAPAEDPVFSDESVGIHFMMTRWLSPAPREYIVFRTTPKLGTATVIYAGTAQPIAVIAGKVLLRENRAPTSPSWEVTPYEGAGVIPFTNSFGTFNATWTAYGTRIIERRQEYGDAFVYKGADVVPSAPYRSRISGYTTGITWSASEVHNASGDFVYLTPSGTFVPGTQQYHLTYAATSPLAAVVGSSAQPATSYIQTRSGAAQHQHNVTFVSSDTTIDYSSPQPTDPGGTAVPTGNLSLTARTVNALAGTLLRRIVSSGDAAVTLADLHAAASDLYLPTPIYLLGDNAGTNPRGPGMFASIGIPANDFAPALLATKLAFDRSPWTWFSNYSLQNYSEQSLVGVRYQRGSSTPHYDAFAPAHVKWDASTPHALWDDVVGAKNWFVAIKRFGATTSFGRYTLAVMKVGEPTPRKIKWTDEILPEPYLASHLAGQLVLQGFAQSPSADSSALLGTAAFTRVFTPLSLMVGRG